jgi:hypothetical protein
MKDLLATLGSKEIVCVCASLSMDWDLRGGVFVLILIRSLLNTKFSVNIILRKLFVVFVVIFISACLV